MLGTVLKDVFADINIYDDDIRLLQQRFVSPIGNNAISFYKYYLMDTLMVNKRECVHLTLFAKLAGLRIHRTSVCIERFYLCRSEMYDEPA